MIYEGDNEVRFKSSNDVDIYRRDNETSTYAKSREANDEQLNE